MRRFAPLCILAAVAVASASTNINGNIAGTSPGTGTAFGSGSTTIYKAAGFTMPSGLGYTLDNAVLTLTADAQAMPMVSIWSGASAPTTQLVTLVNSDGYNGQNDYTFTPTAPFTLQPDTTYWLYMQADPTSAAYTWDATTPSTIPTGVATHVGYLFNGSPSTFRNRFQINGTIVPEPTSLALLGGLALLALRRR